MIKKFTVDAKTILTLGRNSIKDNSTAILELVKNSYDADATTVKLSIVSETLFNAITIVDNGNGMTENEVENNWLRIGFSSKLHDTRTTKSRRKTGEKGIGRLSADRLGALLTLKTKSKNHPIYGLFIDWDKFNHEGVDLGSITLEELESPKMDTIDALDQKKGSGTELKIEKLRQRWTDLDVKRLYEELSILMPPFKKVKDFEIYLETDVTNKYNGLVTSPFYQKAEIELEAIYDGKSNEINYSIKDKYHEAKKNSKSHISWKQLLQKYDKNSDTSDMDQLHCGPVTVRLLFYPRSSDMVKGTDFSLSHLREFLDTNAGVKIYRDNIRVKPYGNPNDVGGDWLGLAERRTREPAAISRPTWKVGVNQLVGAVFISRDDNPNLLDSSSREGLIEEDAFKDLKAITGGCIILLEAYRHELYKKGVLNERVNLVQEVKDVKEKLEIIKTDLEKVPEISQKVIDTVTEVISDTNKLQESQEAVYSESRLLGGLATIGISAAVFGHETQSSISQVISSTEYVVNALKNNPPKVVEAIDESNKAFKFANKISAWGTFALSRIQKSKREMKKVNLKEAVDNILRQLEPVLIAADIELIKDIEDFKAITFTMDIETILVNSITNAYTACLQVNRQRKIKVAIKKKVLDKKDGFELSISDTGPGVDEKLRDVIWEPFFTTKKSKQTNEEIGTGLGLSIVQSIISDLNGVKIVEVNSELKGAKFTYWLPLIN